MKTIKELLQNADPLRHGPEVSSSRRDASRQAVLVAAAQTAGVAPRFRIARLATVSIVVVGFLFLGSRLLSRMGFETHAAVRFEIRLAEDMPGPGLSEARIPGSNRPIYLYPEIIVGNGDIERAEVLPGRDATFVVGVRLTADGARKMRAATQSHIGKPIAILVDDTVVMAPTVRSSIGDQAEINGNFTREQAERIANGLR